MPKYFRLIYITLLLLGCNTLLQAQTAAADTTRKLYDTEPSFPGGTAKYYKFLNKTIRYPAEALNSNMQGRVTVSFIVAVNGTLSDMRVVASPDESLAKETERIFKLSPPWNPATKNGVPMAVPHTASIVFSLSGAPLPSSPAYKDALYILNGTETTLAEVAKVMKYIDNISVLDSVNSKKKYGEKAARGAVIVTTKQ
jgi:TonB family protein